MDPLIHMEGVTKKYGSHVALQDATLDIPAGKIVGLVGPNGAGKTTLMRALTGLISYRGDISVLGMEPMENRHTLMERTGVIHDVSVLPPWMKVSQILDFQAQVHPRFSKSRCEKLLAETSVTENRKIKQLSKGMKTQLHLSLMLATDSDVLILDEPTHGLDILFRKQFYNSVLEDYFDGQKSIIVSTHQIEEVEHILSDVIFIKQGKILMYDEIDNLHKRFVQVTVSDQNLEQARQKNPLQETSLIGKKVLLYKDVSRKEVEHLGEVKTPSLADIFVVLMGGEA
ncbi:MAG: ATP-binding cassette domain-containing protein [Candidatus Marinimicrobia bacterium]|nr:ATP-binding cassette domain-containing protein [Candidatus Neomarinimicrobiota bacterium]